MIDGWMDGWWQLKKPYSTKKSGHLLTQMLSKIPMLIFLSRDHYNDHRLRITRNLLYVLIVEGLAVVSGKR